MSKIKKLALSALFLAMYISEYLLNDVQDYFGLSDKEMKQYFE